MHSLHAEKNRHTGFSGLFEQTNTCTPVKTDKEQYFIFLELAIFNDFWTEWNLEY